MRIRRSEFLDNHRVVTWVVFQQHVSQGMSSGSGPSPRQRNTHECQRGLVAGGEDKTLHQVTLHGANGWDVVSLSFSPRSASASQHVVLRGTFFGTSYSRLDMLYHPPTGDMSFADYQI